MDRIPDYRIWEKARAPECDGDDPYGGEMHYLELGDEKRFVSVGFYHDSCWSHDDFIWLQFTGLLDKSGKKIYEGDVVRGARNSDDDEDGITEVLEVEYRNKGFGYHERGFWVKGEYVGHSGEGLFDWQTFEIIGNIYSNPQLLTNL